ncbi:Putative chloroperoxidase [Septoria linicola]|uniref:Chloroperoxidase n=1 Tax=Septoria linicola TaxID=215465 RepID=A0A9Q9EPY8_9PEZI|nr:Putative chloroperoxidase [Septoria linicola]
MKYNAALLLAPLAAAFPAGILEQVAQDPVLAARSAEILNEKRQLAADSATKVFEAVPNFNEDQLIDVGPGSGHEYKAPGPNDLRGPCPGLNAFANHGFLPHNGYATIQQFIDVTMEVVGMGPILAAFLAVLGATIDGDGTSWSVHGTPPLGVGGPLARFGNGLSGSHNKYESDASPTRPDLYEAGNNYKLVVSQFQQLIDETPSGFVDLNSLTSFRSKRFDAQIANNPYFFNGPFTGVLVQPAAYTFIYRFMSNHSAAAPVGELSHDVLKSWFGITGNSGSFKVNPGQEKIPLNWYRRSRSYPYESTYFLGDAAAAIALYPKFANVGGNTNGRNTFTGVDINNLTGGAMNSQNFLQGNNFACFAYQFAAQAKPDLLGALGGLTGALSNALGPLACPQLQKIDDQLLMQFQGYARSKREGILK